MKILFYDGNLDELLSEHEKKFYDLHVSVVDAKYGPTNNMNYLDKQFSNLILTNSLVALSHVYGWNSEEKHTDIYIWREKYKDFVRCDKLTLREIREAHNIEKIYMAGGFSEEIEEV